MVSCLVRHKKLTRMIREEIDRASHQRISFARFMELALVTPSLGYYQAAENIVGKLGDFLTAPEISSVFASCLARYCAPILKAFSAHTAVIVEIGAGTGKMAADLLRALESFGVLPCRYILVEVSEALREQQKANLQKWVPHLMHLIEQRDQLPSEPIEGIILANEVMDVLPIHRFFVSQAGLQELYVGWEGSQFIWRPGDPSTAYLRARLQQVQERYLEGVDCYCSEVRLSLEAWFVSLQACLRKGCVLLIDYGYAAREYYHPQRSQGTLRCYYQHRCSADPLVRVGLQDITSDVDFSQVAELAAQYHLQIIAYVSQAAFLIAAGLLEATELCYDNELYLGIRGKVHQLIAPTEMGELCKVMVLARGLTCDLLSLEEYDRRVSL
jgi:SAM-dependent MidA family methyltransferase